MTALSKLLLERLVTEAFQHGRCNAKGEALNNELRQAKQVVAELTDEMIKREREVTTRG